MSRLDTFVEFDVSSVDLFQFMTAGMMKYDTRTFLYGKSVHIELLTFLVVEAVDYIIW